MTPKREQKRQECSNYVQLVSNFGDHLPLHFSIFLIYLAYKNLWKLINRDLITDEELKVMKQLNIYKYPRRYEGTSSQANEIYESKRQRNKEVC
jgi:hypothetical protein